MVLTTLFKNNMNPYRETVQSTIPRFYCKQCHIELRILKTCLLNSKCYFSTEHHHLICDRCRARTISNLG